MADLGAHLKPEPIQAPEPQPVRVRDLVRSRDLPDLEVYPCGALVCAICGDEMRLADFCATCFDREAQRWEALQAQVRRDLAEAKRRARTWRLGRVVGQ